MNDYSSLLYSEKSVLATYCYDLTPLTYEKRGMLTAKKTHRKRVSSRNPFSREFKDQLVDLKSGFPSGNRLIFPDSSRSTSAKT